MLRSTFIYLSKSEGFKEFLSGFKSFNKITRRFVAGENVSDAIDAIRELNRKGIAASFDHLGESITSQDETQGEVQEYLSVLARINETGIDSNVSVKLTQLGLDVSTAVCYENARVLVEAAGRQNNFVRIDMEDSSKTDATLDIFRRLRRDHDNTGIVIQAYLRRSEADVRSLLEMGSRIRLCKGAYDEPPSAAFPSKADVDANYVELMKVLLRSGVYHGIATHDEKMIDATKQFAAAEKISLDRFEFQMLYGVRRDLQEALARQGYRMRVYVPYGKFWYPYFMRRLAERPANAAFVLRNMFKG
ncbi:MAG TPA: proline dehydrogenase family protein [Blastocatellia bacterium]|nr:proline dehydrogenase family protein [Blastocatellia bacterium]